MKPGWIKWQQSKNSPYLYAVLRLWGNEYVVHTYNTQSEGYCHGYYCKTFERAETRFLDKVEILN